MKPVCQNQLDSSSRFDTIPTIPPCKGRTDRQTDGQTHDDSVYRASTASRGKNQKQSCSRPKQTSVAATVSPLFVSQRFHFARRKRRTDDTDFTGAKLTANPLQSRPLQIGDTCGELRRQLTSAKHRAAAIIGLPPSD